MFSDFFFFSNFSVWELTAARKGNFKVLYSLPGLPRNMWATVKPVQKRKATSTCNICSQRTSESTHFFKDPSEHVYERWQIMKTYFLVTFFIIMFGKSVQEFYPFGLKRKTLKANACTDFGSYFNTLYF